MLALLPRLGATLVEVRLPELDLIRVAHLVTFLCELYALNKRVLTDDELYCQLHEDSRVMLMAATKWMGADYIQASTQGGRSLREGVRCAALRRGCATPAV